MARRKINERFRASPGLVAVWESAEEAKELANQLYSMAAKQHMEFVAKRNKFWRTVRQQEDWPKSAYVNYDAGRLEFKVLKKKDASLAKQDLEIKLLELEIARLKTLVKEV